MNGIVLITGANRGLGLGFVNYYLNKGWAIIACVRDVEGCTELRQLAEKTPENLKIEALDVSRVSSIDAFSKKFQKENQKLDIVINNAGIFIEESFGNWTTQAFMDTYQTNSVGVALFSQAIVPYIQSKGKLINMSSGLGSVALNVNPEMAFEAYAMSKAALNIFTKRLSSKLETKGKIVIALSPGWVQTDMGGKEAPLTIAEATLKMGAVIENLSLNDSGKFLSEDGEVLPW